MPRIGSFLHGKVEISSPLHCLGRVDRAGCAEGKLGGTRSGAPACRCRPRLVRLVLHVRPHRTACRSMEDFFETAGNRRAVPDNFFAHLGGAVFQLGVAGEHGWRCREDLPAMQARTASEGGGDGADRPFERAGGFAGAGGRCGRAPRPCIRSQWRFDANVGFGAPRSQRRCGCCFRFCATHWGSLRRTLRFEEELRVNRNFLTPLFSFFSRPVARHRHWLRAGVAHHAGRFAGW